MTTRPFRFQVGELTTRSEIAAAYGCATQGGIVASNRSGTVFIFTDHSERKQFGYLYDGFNADGTVFHYTGAGQDGDQSESGSNSPILTHASKGRTIHAFVADGAVPGRQTKRQRYVGEFILDPDTPYERRPAPDREGRTRTVIIFRLLPVSSLAESVLAKIGFSDIKGGIDSLQVPIEISSNYFFETSGTTGGSSVRRESLLVDEFVDVVGRDKFKRWSINLPGERSPLLTDVFDQQQKVLYEAKASAGRSDMRMAVGQLYDYRRHLPAQHVSCAILVPERPKADLRDYVQSAGLGLVFKDQGRFEFELA